MRPFVFGWKKLNWGNFGSPASWSTRFMTVTSGGRKATDNVLVVVVFICFHEIYFPESVVLRSSTGSIPVLASYCCLTIPPDGIPCSQ
jgi:hypothetical protein